MKKQNTMIALGVAAALAAGVAAYSVTASAQPYGGWGMMGGYGHVGGWGHMGGWGGGPGGGQWNCPGFAQGAPGTQALNLTTDDVKNRMERWLAWRGNPRLKVGEVKEKDADTITADIVTKDNSLVERFIVDRHTGFYRRDNS
jgi:hypothetical protein